MTEILFLDLDDTILDFHKAERLAVAKTFREFGLEPTDAVLTRCSPADSRFSSRSLVIP